MSDLQFSVPAAPILVPLWVVGVSVASSLLARRRLLTPRRVVTVLGSATYAVGVLAVTLLPMHVALGSYANQVEWYQKVNLIPVLTIDLPTFLLNVIMTIPLGLLAPLLLPVRTRGRAALIGFGVSLVIELAQAITDVLLSSGRTGDVNDLLANTGGAVLGWYVYTRLRTFPTLARLLDGFGITRSTGAGLYPVARDGVDREV